MMTSAEILAWVDAHASDPAVASALAEGRDGDLAALMSAGRTRVATRLGGIGLVLETLGPTDGAALLDSLYAARDTVPALKWAWTLIDRGELDFGSAVTRAQLDALLPPAAAAALKATAEVADPVDVFAVSAALNERGRA